MRPFRRVFALAPDCHTSTRFRGVWQHHFYDGIEAVVPSVVLPVEVDFAWARPAFRVGRGPSLQREATSERIWEQIQRSHDREGLDAVLSYCFGVDVEPALIERTIELGVPWINFYCDSTYAFDMVEDVARVTSLNWFPERAAIPSYTALGRSLLCRPYAVHPGALPDATSEDAIHPLGFVGAANPRRVALIASLRLLGCRVAVRGNGWQRPAGSRLAFPRLPLPGASPNLRMKGRLGERLLARALAPLVRRGSRRLEERELLPFLTSCRVVLGLNEGRDVDGRWLSYLKLRDVEFPGHGCCYLTQRNEDVAHAFEVGTEVVTFGTAREAASLARDLVRDPERARAIGRAGRQRVLAEHTWATRVRELAEAL